MKMVESFLIVGKEIIVVFALMAAGFLCGKLGIIDKSVSRGLSSLAVNLTIPATILMSFRRSFTVSLLKDFLFAALIAAGSYVLGILLSNLTVREKDERKRNVIRSSIIFNNCAMLAMPLQSALLGADGVFFGAAHAGMFNLFFWTYGISIISGSRENASLKKALLNPCLLCTFAGLILFLCNIQLPELFYSVTGHISDMNLPLSLMVIGYTISSTEIGSVFRDKWCWIAAAEKLIIIPLILIGILVVFGKSGTSSMSSVIAVASPAAASINILAVLYGKDEKLAAGLVSISTIASLLTLPVITAFAQTLLG